MNVQQIYLLDSEALSRAARGERRMGARLKDADQTGVRVMTTAMTLIEAYDMRARQAAWQWTLSRIHVEPVTEDVSNDAIQLLKSAGPHGHKYAIDAVLAAVVLRQKAPVTVFTSDKDDVDQLCGDRVVVFKL